MSPLTRESVAALYTPIYDEFMLAVYSEDTQVHPKIFQVIEDSTKEYKVDDISGLGEWVDANEGEGGGYEDPVLGYPKTYTQAKKWKKFKVSFEAVDQDEYALIKKEGEAREMGRGGRAKVERTTAAHLSDGFSTAAADGQFLWDADHPKNRDETGTTYDNLLSGALSHDNLELAETQIAKNFFTMAGLPIETIEDPLLVYPPALRGIAARLLSDRANEQPDTTMRNINRFAGRYVPVEWKWLQSTLGGSDTAWFIIYKELGHLKIIWSQKPHFTSWIDHENEFYHFKGRMLWDSGPSNWRAGFGSTGA